LRGFMGERIARRGRRENGFVHDSEFLGRRRAPPISQAGSAAITGERERNACLAVCVSAATQNPPAEPFRTRRRQVRRGPDAAT
jgi:hypothetical protein